jgi:hypothetical protein
MLQSIIRLMQRANLPLRIDLILDMLSNDNACAQFSVNLNQFFWKIYRKIFETREQQR